MLDHVRVRNFRIIRPRRSRSAAAYSRQTSPWTICRSVRTCVGLSSALWKNDASDPDAVWHRRSDGSRDKAGSGVWESVHRKGILGEHLGRAIVSNLNGDFTAYVCDSAATRPSSQITLGRHVIIIVVVVIPCGLKQRQVIRFDDVNMNMHYIHRLYEFVSIAA